MCELCTNKEAAVKNLLSDARQLERFAGLLKDLAYGNIGPHSKEAEALERVAKTVLRIAVDYI